MGMNKLKSGKWKQGLVYTMHELCYLCNVENHRCMCERGQAEADRESNDIQNKALQITTLYTA